MSENENLLTVPQAAEVLGVTQGAIRNALYRGMLPYLSKYGRRLVSASDLQAYHSQANPKGRVKRGRPRVDSIQEDTMKASTTEAKPAACHEKLSLAELLALPTEERDVILAVSMASFAQDFADDDVRDFDALDADGLDDIET